MSGHFVGRLHSRGKVHDRRAFARHLMLGLLFGLACQCALAQAMYRIVPLRCPGRCTSNNFSGPDANGFNNADEVAGTVYFDNGSYHAFLWKNDGNPMIDLGPDKVGSDSVGYGLNASGRGHRNGNGQRGYLCLCVVGRWHPNENNSRQPGWQLCGSLRYKRSGGADGGSRLKRRYHARHCVEKRRFLDA